MKNKQKLILLSNLIALLSGETNHSLGSLPQVETFERSNFVMPPIVWSVSSALVTSKYLSDRNLLTSTEQDVIPADSTSK